MLGVVIGATMVLVGLCIALVVGINAINKVIKYFKERF